MSDALDVAVVGASLAGAATAIHLAEAGHRVVVLERHAEDRRKACGEGLFPRGVAQLERLGLLDEIQRLGQPLAGVRFHAGEHVAEARFGGGGATGLGIQRAHLDPLLRARAREVGVDLRPGVSVRSLLVEGNRLCGVRTASGDEVRARVVVAADGLRSRLRTQAGLDRPASTTRYGVSAHVRLPANAGPFVDVHFEDGFEVYVTPVGGRVVNVAMLLRRRAMPRFAGRLAEAFEEVLGASGVLPVGAALADEPLAAGPFPARSLRAWRQNLVLVGDAAGFLDAISGEGMSTTLVSARRCALAVSEYLVSGSAGDAGAFRRYDRSRRSLVRNADLLARVSLALSSRPALARHAVRNLSKQPATFERLAGVSAGELRLRALRPRDLWGLALGV